MSNLTNKQTNKQKIGKKRKENRCFFRFLEFGVISFVYREREEKDLRVI